MTMTRLAQGLLFLAAAFQAAPASPLVQVSGPDLVVESPRSTESSIAPGGAFRFAATVRNQGASRSAATTLRYYRSSDSRISTSDTFLGSDSITALSASATVRESVGQRAPATPGSYYYGACVDSVSGESDTGNNCSNGVRVTVTAGELGFALASDNESPRGITYAGGRFYVVDSSDEEVYAYRSDGRRYATGDFDLRSVNADPQGITYYRSVFYVLDVDDEKVYAYRDGRRDADAEFDLDAANRSALGITYAAGRFYVADLSDGRVYAYRSSDGRRDGAAEFNLTGANGYPSGMAYGGGRFYVVDRDDDKVYAYRSDGRRDAGAEFNLDSANGDPDGVVYFEDKLFVVDSRNNRVYIYSVDGEGSGADLVVESPRSTETSVAPRGAFRFAATVRNQGDALSAATTLSYYRSSDSRISTSDTRVGTDRIGALSPSATDRQSVGLRAPTTSGTYYYGACVDSVTGESNTGNNCSQGVRVTVTGGGTSGPDLVVESPRSTETSVAPRGTFRFAATVINRGRDRSDVTTLRYYRSTDSRITTADTQVGTDRIGGLSGSGSAQARPSIGQRAPQAPGIYYYGACVDPVSGESNTGNNCSSAVRITVTGGGTSGPDLVVESPRSTETSVAPRGTFRFAATVINRGRDRSDVTTLRYYRSTDSRITTADTQVGTDRIGGLSGSGSAQARPSIGQRAPQAPGTYYYGACVDPVSGESNTGNNCSSAVRITVTDDDTGGDEGEVLFSEDYESHAVGSLPSDYVIVFNGRGTGEQRVESESGNQHLRTAGRYAWSLAMRKDFDFDLPQIVSVMWRMRVDEDLDRYEYTDSTGARYANFGGFGIKNMDEVAASISINKYESDRKIVAWCPEGGGSRPGLEIGQWAVFRMDVDFSAGRYAMYMNGRKFCERDTSLADLSGRWNSWGESAAIRFASGNSDNTTTRFDDIVVRAGNDGTGGRALASFGKFHVIAHDLTESQDHGAECKSQLGSGSRLADWNDIVDYHDGGGSLAAFADGLKMSVEGGTALPGDIASGYRISRDGNAIYSGNRHYFVARHNHNRPGYFLAHAHLDNHYLSLGSWYGTGGYALCYGGSNTPAMALPSGGVLRTSVTSFNTTSAYFVVDLFVVDSASNLVPIDETDLTIEQLSWRGGQLRFSATEVNRVNQSGVGPYSATFLFDQSGSIETNDPLDLRIEAARTFLGNLAAGDEVALLAFAAGSGSKLPQTPVTVYRDASGGVFTRNPEGFREALRDLASLEGGGTPLYDAIEEAVRFTVANSSNSNRAVIVFTDGEDTNSTATLDDAVEWANSRNVSLHSIALAQGVDLNVLSRLAGATGGSFAQAFEAEQLISYYGALGPYLSGTARYYRTVWRVDHHGGTTGFRAGDSIRTSVAVRVPGGVIHLPFRLDFE